MTLEPFLRFYLIDSGNRPLADGVPGCSGVGWRRGRRWVSVLRSGGCLPGVDTTCNKCSYRKSMARGLSWLFSTSSWGMGEYGQFELQPASISSYCVERNAEQVELAPGSWMLSPGLGAARIPPKQMHSLSKSDGELQDLRRGSRQDLGLRVLGH